jgi:hypothetical protein
MTTLLVKDEPATTEIEAARFNRKWLLLVALLIAIAGGVRWWRDWQFQSLAKESEAPPFSLAEFPEALGDWRAIRGSESALEPEIARIAGASDYLIRTYVDEKTGDSAVVMILYGLASVVWPHSPDACYPAQGFGSISPSRDRDLEIAVPGTQTVAPFREQHFVKTRTGKVDYRQVYHSFLHAGRWGLDMAKDWKSFRYHPGMFRVQVQRQGTSSDRIDDKSVRELLGQIVREIESRLGSSQKAILAGF